MPKDLTWLDAEDIGILLQEKFPDDGPSYRPIHGLAPVCDRVAGLHRLIPAKSNESKLEAIQMAWHEEYLDAK